LFEEAQHFDTLHRWSTMTKSGDRSELSGVPERLSFWKGISARSENCTGKECPEFDRCYVTRLRQRASESEIVVVNHHLLFADLLVRESSFGEVIPEYDYLVLDEVHQIEDVATQYFGVMVSTARVEELARDVETSWQAKGRGKTLANALRELTSMRNASRTLFDSFRGESERYRVRPQSLSPVQSAAVDRFEKQLNRVRSRLGGIPSPDETTVALTRRAGELSEDLSTILMLTDPESVSWCESRERFVALRSSPIDVAPLLRQLLFEKKRAVLMTSATLSVDRSFGYVGSRVGVDVDDCVLLPSPFDYREQALLYVPRNIAPPRDARYLDEAAREVEALVSASRGRAFVLFTSFANLRALHGRLVGKLPYPLLVQGEAPKNELLDRFRETKGAILFATSSFWEGVDVLGDQLSCVVVDKLPFAVPSDPLVSARIDNIERSGGNGFQDYQVPMAILSLKQGLGRLIRSRTDRGVVAILDSRVASMAYGRRFLTSLPPYRLTHDRGEVERFFRARASDASDGGSS
jgi:ATP-dependent DNA helicase DinG